MRKRSQSAGPGKFDKKMGKEDSFDQVKIFNEIHIYPFKTTKCFCYTLTLLFFQGVKVKSPKLRGEEESGEEESELNLKKPTPGISTLPKVMLPNVT